MITHARSVLTKIGFGEDDDICRSYFYLYRGKKVIYSGSANLDVYLKSFILRFLQKDNFICRSKIRDLCV